MPKLRILLVDDNPDIRSQLPPILEREGFEVVTASNGREALHIRTASSPFHLILLDINMPEMNGRDVLRTLRSNDDWIPVILLTELKGEFDIYGGLGDGADDYIPKPFGHLELLARVKRRILASEQPHKHDRFYISHPIKLDRYQRELWLNNQKIELSKREFAVLALLMSHPMQVITRDTLLVQVWKSSDYVDRVVDVTIARIREALGEYRNLIETIKGEGYQFCAEVHHE